jgi:hypothetical protein
MHTGLWRIAATGALEAMQRTLDLPAVEQQPPKCAIRLWPPVIQAQSLAKRMQRTDAIVDAEKRIAQAMPDVRPRVIHCQPSSNGNVGWLPGTAGRVRRAQVAGGGQG